MEKYNIINKILAIVSRQIEEECTEEGYPSNGSNFDLRLEAEIESLEGLSLEELRAYYRRVKYRDLLESAAGALLQWERANSFTEVARLYSLAYNYTCEAIALHVQDKEGVFRAISRQVLAWREAD